MVVCSFCNKQIPKDFRHCVWLTLTDESHPLNDYISGVQAHMTIQSNLDLEKANILYDKLKNDNIRLNIELVGDLKQSEVDDFYALEQSIKIADETPIPYWWPDKAHVSLGYRYGKSFTDEEIGRIQKRVNMGPQKAEMSNVLHVLCRGHYTTWMNLDLDTNIKTITKYNNIYCSEKCFELFEYYRMYKLTENISID